MNNETAAANTFAAVFTDRHKTRTDCVLIVIACISYGRKTISWTPTVPYTSLADGPLACQTKVKSWCCIKTYDVTITGLQIGKKLAKPEKLSESECTRFDNG